jgi:hypothetical protein
MESAAGLLLSPTHHHLNAVGNASAAGSMSMPGSPCGSLASNAQAQQQQQPSSIFNMFTSNNKPSFLGQRSAMIQMQLQQRQQQQLHQK